MSAGQRWDTPIMNRTTDITFSREAWDQNARAYEIIRTMPFNTQLADGTLSVARFKYYITQDAHYLIGFGRALTLAAAKAPSPDRIVQFAKAAEVAIIVERALHGSFFEGGLRGFRPPRPGARGRERRGPCRSRGGAGPPSP